MDSTRALQRILIVLYTRTLRKNVDSERAVGGWENLNNHKNGLKCRAFKIYY